MEQSKGEKSDQGSNSSELRVHDENFHRKVLFPYSNLRPYQAEMLLTARDSFENRKHLLINAPTGVGKTSILGPAISVSTSDPNVRRVVFFLTSRQMQHVIAVDTVSQIKKKYELNISAADIIGRQSMCSLPGAINFLSSDFGDYCNDARQEYTCEHYVLTRKKGGSLQPVASELVEELKKRGPMHAERIQSACRLEKFCPYEISMALAANADVIIADYYHIFHPHIRGILLKKIGLALTDCIIIVDEAHNLPSRIRKIFSSKITSIGIRRAIKEAKKFAFTTEVEYVVCVMDAINVLSQKMFDGQEILVRKETFIDLVEKAAKKPLSEITAELELCAEFIRRKQQKSRVGGIANFLALWQGGDKGFARILSVAKIGRETLTTLSYKCLDPSIVSKEVMEATHSVAMMSATLTPQEMYVDLLGFPKEKTISVSYKNPFPENNRLCMIVPMTTTKYSERSPAQFKEIAEIAAKMVNSVPGNSLVFFPSYSLRDAVRHHFNSLCDKTVFHEVQNMTKNEKTEMLEKFREYKDSKRYAVLLAVSSGSFGEGIDLPGLLSCVIVAGLPLSAPDLETKELISYYDEKFGKGWDYGYTMPAMNKVVQAVGRCIRSEKDKGALIFLDKRFAWEGYKKCFPKDWEVKISVDFENQIRTFFGI